MITSQGFAVIVAMQIRARVLLKQTEVRNMYFSNVAMMIYSLGNDRIGLKDYLPRFKIYSNCCNADPCMGTAYTNWLCCHDSLGGTSLV